MSNHNQEGSEQLGAVESKHSPSATRSTYDVLIVGAGLAGSALAAVLARKGRTVAVVDPNTIFPQIFRAEKIERDQTELLLELGLFGDVEAKTRTIEQIIHGMNGRIVYRKSVRQFGISYGDIVNSVRRAIPPNVTFVRSRVENIQPDEAEPTITLSGGERLRARLVVVASGMSSELHQTLNVSKERIKDGLSLAFGFMLRSSAEQKFNFDALTYKPNNLDNKVGYITIFRMGEYMRANLFSYWTTKDPLIREMLTQPAETIVRILPGISNIIGDFSIQGKVEPFKIDLYRIAGYQQPGVVFIGDAYQSVCPSTGLGLTKVLTDVKVLCNEFIPQWLNAPKVSEDDAAMFYRHRIKSKVDDYAIRMALTNRSLVLNDSLLWSTRRFVRGARFRFGI